MSDEDQYEYLDKGDMADIIYFLRRGVLRVEQLIQESAGVAGLHFNGDTAYWAELLKDGEYDAWLKDLSKAIEVAHEQV